MSKTITRVSHRHGDQKRSDPDLVIEVGRSLPDIYERPGREVRSIEGKDPLRCTLDDGDIVYIGQRRLKYFNKSLMPRAPCRVC